MNLLNEIFITAFTSLVTSPQVRIFVPDTIPPSLDHFDLDLNSNVLTLVFTKTVNASTLLIGGITLQSYGSVNNMTVSYTLTNGIFTNVNNPIIQIQLSTFDSNLLRLLPTLTKSANTTYISAISGAVYDMVNLPLIGVNSSSAQKVGNFTSDTSRPSLLQFFLDLSQETLTFYFSETVQISSFDATQVALSYGNNSYTLTGGAIVNQTNTPNLTLTLTTADLNAIKSSYPLATSQNTTYISITALGVTDVFINPLIPVTTLRASGYMADTVQPRLLGFGLDMNLGTLTLTFSETVNSSSLSTSGLTLQPSANTTFGLFPLTGTSFTASLNGPILQVDVSSLDLNALKQLTYLALSNKTVFLSVAMGTVLDMGGNALVGIPTSSALLVSAYVYDTTMPRLVAFVLDRDMGTLVLTFSETVNATSIKVAGLSLQSSPSSNMDSVNLTGGAISNVSSPIITVTMLSTDLNVIKSHTGLGTTVNDTYITATSQVVNDMFTNPLVPIHTTSALAATLVIADKTPPVLKAYDLDMNTGTITFSFSESVNASTFDPSQVTLQSGPVTTAYTTNYTLTGFSNNQSLVSMVSETIIVFQISTTDLNNIKMMVTMATSQNNTYLSLTSGFVQDQSKNAIVSISSAAGQQVQKYTPDTTCPPLDAFQLDLNLGLLSLTFGEPVNSSVLNTSQIVVQNLKVTPTVKYTLTGGSLNCSQYTLVVVLVLSSYDLNLLKSKTLGSVMGTSPQNTFVQLIPSSIADTRGNAYCNNTQPFGATGVIADQTPPTLVSFNLDMNTGILVLNFSEVLDLSQPFTVGAITLQSAPVSTTVLSNLLPTISPTVIGVANGSINSYNQTYLNGTSTTNQTTSSNSTAVSNQTSLNASISLQTLLAASGVSYYTLTGGTAYINLTTTPNIVTLLLTPNDLNAIKNTSGLAISSNTVYASVAAGLAYDFKRNQVMALSLLDALRVSVYVPDYTPPSVLSFTLDMNTNQLALTFSETITISSFLPSAITMQSSAALIPGQARTLQGGVAYLDPATPTTVRVQLTLNDTNAIKLTRVLAKTPTNSTYLSLTSNLVANTFNISVVAINNTAGLPGTLVPDATPPHLVTFSLNMSSEVLVLTFDEPVAASSLRPTSITLQPTSSSALDTVPLTGGNVTLVDSTVIYVKLSKADLNTIKQNDNLATSANDTCISFTATMATDLAVPPNQVLVGVACTEAFAPDLVQPQLVSFAVNVNTSQLILNFDEPVDMTTFNVKAITLQSSRAAVIGVENFTLTGGQESTLNQLQVTVTMTNADLNKVKQGFLLLRSLATSFASIMAALVQDTSGNPITAISISNALQASMYIGDGRNPMLLTFDLDMNNGRLTLHFSETVNVSTVNFGGITLQLDSSVESNSTNFYTLTKGVVLTTSNTPDVVLLLNNTDVNALKTQGIATGNLTTWITLSAAVKDTTALVALDVINGVNALPVTMYTPDTNLPMLQSFTIDMNAGTLTLSFNETVTALSLDATQLTLASGRNITDSAHTYTLTNTSSVASQLNLPTVTIILSTTDLNRIKQLATLYTSVNNSYLYLSSHAVADTSGNLNTAILPPQAIRALLFTPDKTLPVFVGFDLDMNMGTFTLTFSETVNPATLYVTGMTLYDDDLEPTVAYQLRGPYTNVSTPSNVIIVTVNNNDLNAIKAQSPLLATSDAGSPYTSSNTFLTMATFTVRDMSSNNVTGVYLPMRVSRFVPDTTPPQLLSFSVNMNTSQLTLNFSETVLTSSLHPTYLSLLSNATFVPIPYNPADQQQLSGGTLLTYANSFSVTFQLSDEDSNTIKAKNMCTRALGVLGCYMAYGTGAVQDMSNNFIIGCRYLY